MEFNTVLTANTAPQYAPLTYPRFRRLLEQFDQFQDSTVAVGYHLLGEPAGLGLAQLCPDCQAAHVHSLFVRSAYRERGIGTALLTGLEQEVAQREYDRVSIEYPADHAETPALEQVLGKCGWQPPKRIFLRCAVLGKQAVDALMAAPWMHAPLLPAGFELFAWNDLSRDERQQIECQRITEQDGHCADIAVAGHPFEPLTSIGLRYHGEVVGWMLNRRTAPGRVLYDWLAFKPQLRGRGYALTLVVAAIQRQYALDGHLPDVGGVWRTRLANLPMVRVIKRRLQPYLTTALETSTSAKELDRSPP
jgi:ribosomal protein S18 acetylase RimI-like enzyme